MGIPTAEGYTPSGAASTKRGARGSRGTRRAGRDRPPPPLLLLRARVRLAGRRWRRRTYPVRCAW
jgi:hypothetical protein